MSKCLIWEGDPSLRDLAINMSQEELNALYGCIYVKVKGPWGVFNKKAYLKIGSGVEGLREWIDDNDIRYDFGGINFSQKNGKTTLFVKKGHAGKVIGPAGKNIKRLAQILGLGFIEVIEASEKSTLKVSLVEKNVSGSLFGRPFSDRTPGERVHLTPGTLTVSPSGEIVKTEWYSQCVITWKIFLEEALCSASSVNRSFGVVSRNIRDLTLSEKKLFLLEVYAALKKAEYPELEECFVEKHLNLI